MKEDQVHQTKAHATANAEFETQDFDHKTNSFIDNRPQATAQRRMQETIKNSPQMKHATQLHSIINSGQTKERSNTGKGSGMDARTGLPHQLKTGIENLSGFSMDDVSVHRNSAKPAQLQAHAYAQGTDIHLGPGQEKHLPHEAWHVVQQKQGRVKPTTQMKGRVNVNDDAGLESEADVMGAKAMQNASQMTGMQMKAQALPSSKPETNFGHSMQMKRDISQEQTRTDFSNLYRGENSDDEDTVEVALTNYGNSLASGKKVMGHGLKWFTNSPEKLPAISEESTSDAVRNAGYQIFWFFSGDEVTILMSRGSKVRDSKSKEVSGYNFDHFHDDQDFFYANSFNVKTGEFSASINYKNLDDELADKEGLPKALPNSEIIWFMQNFAKRVYKEKYPEAEPLSELTSISREEIANTQTLDTIFISDEKREAFLGDHAIFNEPTDEAIALLGSPNGKSAIWSLIQHRESGSVDIENIEVENDSMIIRYMSVGE